MTDAIEIARRHLASWPSRDRLEIARTTAFPFIQYREDGTVHSFANAAAELTGWEETKPFTVEFIDAVVVAAGPQVSVVKISFRWIQPENNLDSIGEAIWGILINDKTAGVLWRQFLRMK